MVDHAKRKSKTPGGYLAVYRSVNPIVSNYVQRGKFACASYVYLSLLELLGILTSPKKG